MLRRRVIATAVTVAALALAAVAMVSFTGNDKPEIVDYLPPADESQDDTSDDQPEPSGDVQPPADDDDGLPADDDQADDELPDEGDEDELPDDDDQSDDDDDQSDDDEDDGCPGKQKGLRHAIQMHERNIERLDQNMAKHAVEGKFHEGAFAGLENSLEKLCDNLEKQESKDDGQKGDNGQGNDDKDKDKDK